MKKLLDLENIVNFGSIATIIGLIIYVLAVYNK